MDLAGVFQAAEDFPDSFVNGFPALLVEDVTEVLGEVVAPIEVWRGAVCMLMLIGSWGLSSCCSRERAS